MNNSGSNPKKSLGQHFLKNPQVLNRIIEGTELTQDNWVVEIGPGTGNLTRLIANETDHWWALEKDKVLCAKLAEKYPDQIIETDARRFDYKTLPLPSGQKLKLLGNLPYNVANDILLNIIPYRDIFSLIICMVQQEVADRIAATCGTKAYGVLTITLQVYFDVEKLFDVPPEDFYPPPKVTSSVIRLVPHAKPKYDISDEALFFQLVKSAFSQRRKTLTNNLTGFQGLNRQEIIKILQETNIDPSRRAETLSIKDFAHLSQTIKH